MLVLSAIILTLYLNAFTVIPLIPLIFVFIYIRRYFLCITVNRVELRLKSSKKSIAYNFSP